MVGAVPRPPRLSGDSGRCNRTVGSTRQRNIPVPLAARGREPGQYGVRQRSRLRARARVALGATAR
ncbi:hypothetical protein EYE40_09205 [Glaciihabitans arcticus]|uniref:Uncharacterized protein n=1 Tax=Glaciihabitans arcticus TaxID=2668039 RepID=A0A4Q9GSB7_9MICO|nr:hypothetical protein EYE40_09205 [Glaciihabitans arcticus]